MRTKKPWGYEELIIKTNKYAMKLIHVEAGKRLSLQYHNIKEETMYIINGEGEFTCGPLTLRKIKGAHIHIVPMEIHRVKALSDLDIMECSTPELDDVVRLEDDYGRVSKKEAI